MELVFRWAEPKDFNALLDFYVAELVLCPEFIASPELREGMKTTPTEWLPRLKQAAATYLMETFSPTPQVLRMGILETPVPKRKTKKVTTPKVAAFLRIQTSSGRAAFLDILVAEHLRGQGWGSKLLQAAQADLEAGGFSDVTLSVAIQHADAARFFVRNGFMPYASLFAKKLSPPAQRLLKL